MKVIFSEFKPNYKNYYFPYQVYLKKEAGDDVDLIYQNGFLPARITTDLFYLARSVRIDLKNFQPTSENRRIERKNNYLSIAKVSYKDFKYSYEIGKLGKDFYDAKFGKKIMSAYKLKWLFTSGCCSHILVFKDKSKERVLGYCPCFESTDILHYAYPFYDISLPYKDLGMGMMLAAIKLAFSEQKKYVYLGTLYTESSLYKLQFKGIEYFTGYEWSSDIEELKKLVRDFPNGHILEYHLDKLAILNQKGLQFG